VWSVARVLYSHVVLVKGRKTILLSAQVARDRNGAGVGAG
jgi:hypothetical protein